MQKTLIPLPPSPNEVIHERGREGGEREPFCCSFCFEVDKIVLCVLSLQLINQPLECCLPSALSGQ